MWILRRLKLLVDALSGEQQRVPLPLGCNLFWCEEFSRRCGSLRRRLLLFNRLAFPASRHECRLYSVGDNTYGRSCLGFQLHRGLVSGSAGEGLLVGSRDAAVGMQTSQP